MWILLLLGCPLEVLYRNKVRKITKKTANAISVFSGRTNVSLNSFLEREKFSGVVREYKKGNIGKKWVKFFVAMQFGMESLS